MHNAPAPDPSKHATLPVSSPKLKTSLIRKRPPPEVDQIVAGACVRAAFGHADDLIFFKGYQFPGEVRAEAMRVQ